MPLISLLVDWAELRKESLSNMIYQWNTWKLKAKKTEKKKKNRISKNYGTTAKEIIYE